MEWTIMQPDDEKEPHQSTNQSSKTENVNSTSKNTEQYFDI